MTEMSKEAAEKLEAFNAKQTDWYGTCRKCGKALQGTMRELREHQCGTASKSVAELPDA